TSSRDAWRVVSSRLPKYSMPTNFVVRKRLSTSSTAARSGPRSSLVKLTKTRAGCISEEARPRYPPPGRPGIAGHQGIDLDHRLKKFFSALSANVKVALDRLSCIPRCSAIGIDHKRIDFALVVATEHTQNYLGDPVRGGVTYPPAANSKNRLP